MKAKPTTMKTMTTTTRLLTTISCAALLASATGCAGHVSSTVVPPAPAASSRTAPAPAGQPAASGPVVANGHGWTAEGGLEGPMPAPGTCHTRHAADGGELPDPTCTPGSTDPTVTQANVDSTLGRPGGYTASVRPPAQLTEAAKKKLMAAYGIPWSEAGSYELDHVTPLCAAGSSDLRNLFPMKNVFLPGLGHKTSMDHNSKDTVEDYVCSAVRKHTVRLADAQKTMAADWTTAVKALGLPPIPADYAG
jgi:hypothetical protein